MLVIIGYGCIAVVTFVYFFNVRFSPFFLIRLALFWPITLPLVILDWWKEERRKAEIKDILDSFSPLEKEEILKTAKRLGVK